MREPNASRVERPGAASRVLAVAALLALTVVACAPAPPPNGGNGGGNGDQNGGDGCFVHLYDADNLDASDDNFRLTTPGRYGDLSSLPGAEKDWDDEADSMRVGDSARVTLWSEPEFGGGSQEYGPGDYPELEPEPRSLELSCS